MLSMLLCSTHQVLRKYIFMKFSLHNLYIMNSPVRHRLLPPVGGGHGVCVGETGRGVCVVQGASHHNGAGKGIVVIPWGISVDTYGCD